MSNLITYNYTGSVQTFVTSSTTTEINVELYGAEGGGNTGDPDTSGGLGGKITGTLSVTGGTTFYLYVGGMGTNTQFNDTSDINYAGGYNGGGTGGKDTDPTVTNNINGAGGGGGTDIRTSTDLNTRIIVAGGGGGSGYAGNGGNGGGTIGTNGSTSITRPSLGAGGGGGTDTTGGDVSNNRGSGDGVLGSGGNATVSYAYGSGGGGGGYYGGAAGTSTANNPDGWSAGGGGGSSWVGSYLKPGTSATHTQGNNNGNGKIIITYDDDEADISSVSWSVINSKVSVEFSEAVYPSSTSQTSDLSNLNFNLSISGGVATIASTPTSTIVSNSNKTFDLDIDISGIPDGSEVLTINPSASNSIYNSSGNKSSTSQTNNTIYLIERVLPYITSTTINDYSHVIVTFNEPVYPSSTSQIYDLSSSNFTLALTGGNAITLSSVPTSCSNSNDTVFTLGLGFNSTESDGTEVITVTPANNSSIFDIYGNASSIVQSNNTITLGDSIGPIITDVSMSTDNSNIIVTFNENIFNASTGSGSLEINDFTITLTGGIATLSSVDSISTTNNVSTIGVVISNIANGLELITIVPSSSNTIYDSSGNAASVSQNNNTIYLVDKTPPIITSTSLASDNSTISVTINEAVNNSINGGSLTVNNFDLSASGGTATVNSIPSSINKSSNVYTLGIDLSNTIPNGSEILTVNPNSIYDIYGNQMTGSQSNNTVSLNNKVLPYIKNIAISSTNDSVDVSFNTTVYSGISQSGPLTVNDFSLTTSGGVATVTSTPTSISSSGLIYTLGFNLSGNPSGDELFKVSPVINSIYDADGNISAINQSNNTIYLNAPRISGISLNYDNTIVTVNFNVNVFNTDSGSGNLENTDFRVVILSGVAYLSSQTPKSISGSGSTYNLELANLIGIPNGQEYITVTPVNNTSIYDSGGNSLSTNQQNNSIYLNEKIIPYITNTILQNDNSSINVTFSEVVYDTSNGAGILEKDDFELAINGGVATVNSTPTNISTSDNITFTLNLDISGIPNGSEILKVTPTVNSIYDNSGNVTTITQTNNTVTLNEKIVPIITNIVINNDNSIIIITFNEKVFNSSSGTGNLDVSDFRLSCSVSGILSSTTPSSILQSGNKYSLGITLASLPTGQEIITVQPYSNSSIYDSAGNAASTTQSNNTIHLREQSAPIINNVSINSDNSLITVTFNEKVYNTDAGSGKLETNDFILSITNGYSSLAYDYPYSITAQSDLSSYILGIPLIDKCDGNEILTVNPRTITSIYDGSGNASSVSQYSNTVTLNHTLGPIITGIAISSDYQYITVDFSENVYADYSSGTNIASGSLDVNDFKFSLYNGTASLSSTIPLDISNSGFTYTLGISISGTIDGNEQLTVYPNIDSIYDSSGNVSVISNQVNNIITLTENIVPIIISSIVNNNNSIISITLSEEVYDTSNGNGNLETSDFSLIITGGTATLTSSTPTSISSSSNTYYLGFTLIGIPNGKEIITISPTNNSIFDINGNILSTSQSNNTVTLNKKTLPEINNISISSDNKNIIINFSEEVYTSINMIGELRRDNFEISLSGGSATLTSSTPLSIYRVNPYYLGINIIGTPDGNETLSVVPIGIYDSEGNSISTVQSNNVNIIEKVNPYITSTTISNDNKILTVTFSELVYSNSTATESLIINSFSLYTNSNRGVLKSLNPMSVTQSNLSYLLELDLGATPKLNDYISVNLAENSIYDSSGNIASSTQSNNIVLFNTMLLQDEKLLTVIKSQSIIKKKKIIGNSAKSKYSTSGVSTAAPVNN